MSDYGADELSPELRAAIKQTVRETLFELGVDASSPDAIFAVREDFAYLRKWRRAVDTLGIKGAIALFLMALSGAAGAFWIGLKSIISGAKAAGG